MKFSAAKCPQCGGDLQVPDNKDVVKCMYCGVDVVVREAILLVSSDANNLYELGCEAQKIGDFQGAYEYFSRVLESQPNNADAWLNKGSCAGWLSSLVQLRFSEMVGCHKKALACAKSDADTEVLKMSAAQQQLLVAKAVFDLSTNHAVEFISVPRAKFEHLDRCKEIIAVCEESHSLYGEDFSAALMIVDVASRCSKVGGSDLSYFNAKMQKYKGVASKYFPASSSGVGAGNKSDCFVVTATMGNSNHPDVVFLRQFRDGVLASSGMGQMLIRVYNNVGPILADFIRDVFLLRFLSYLFFVVPLVAFAKFVNIFSRFR
jgi:hypothetical protein